MPLYYIVLFCIALYYYIPYRNYNDCILVGHGPCTVLYYLVPVVVVSWQAMVPVLYCTILYCTVLYCLVPVVVVSWQAMVPASLDVQSGQVEPGEGLVLLLEQVVRHLISNTT